MMSEDSGATDVLNQEQKVEETEIVVEKKTDLNDRVKSTSAYSAIRLQRGRRKRRFDLYDIDSIADPVKLGYIVPQIEKELEAPFPEPHLQEAADEVCFYGVNSKSEYLLVRIARGANQVAEAWLYLKLANGQTYRLPENKGHQHPFEDKCQIFSCGHLQMHYLSPMRQWRIFFCGMLLQTSETQEEELVFVKFLFLWKASSDVYDLISDVNLDVLAQSMTKVEWSSKLSPPLDKITESLNFYAQTGVIAGTVSINDGPDYEMYLFGEKMRSFGAFTHLVGAKFTNFVGNLPKNGLGFHLGEASVPNLFSDLAYGFVVSPDGNLETLKRAELDIGTNEFDGCFKSIKANFMAGRAYEMEGEIVGEPILLRNGQGWNGIIEVSFVKFTIKEKEGFGLFMRGEIHDFQNELRISSPSTLFPKVVPLSVQFTDAVSHFGEVSGGKGSSLGKLTQLSTEEKTFTVPKGIVVTTAAYKEFLTPVIEEAVKQLQNVVYGNVEGDPHEACDMVSTIVVKSLLPTKICNSIKRDLDELFGEDLNIRKFAVRSSATGEDTAAMSAAGQMDTFLGVQGLDEIFLAVKKCWASQFGYIAVEYKRRNGQILDSPMAVVVQEMVASEVSGVLFTCDPVTNNPSVITITANYGLGETVMSGSVEPDTVILKRQQDGRLDLDFVSVGSKLQRLILKEDGGTITEDIPEESRSSSCLTVDKAMELGNIAIKVEGYYKSTRDIEWAISSDVIYMLQSRPVTNIAAETDYEMKHEFDSAMRCENEFFTTANVGEVLPGATSPLGLEITFKYLAVLLKKYALSMGMPDNLLQSKYFSAGLLVFYNHIMTSTEMITRYGFDTPMSKGFTISIFGRVIEDPEIINFTREKHESSTAPPPKQNLNTRIRNYKNTYLHDVGWDSFKKEHYNLDLKFLKHKTAHKTFRSLMYSCSDFVEAGLKYMIGSEVSSSWNMNLFQILSESRGGVMDTVVYSDFASLLATSSNVESANVPQAMQELASLIAKDIPSQSFKSMTVQEASDWLENSTSLAGEKYREFILRHGHRCLKEIDVRTVTWGMDPKPLVKLLQNMAGVVKENGKKEKIDDSKLISGLQSPLGAKSKWKLRFVLPQCRKAIRSRENGKSCLVKSFDHWRKGCRRLAQQMVSEGRIPDEDLLFYMTLDEINDLLQTRSPSIISRANSRKKIYPVLDSYQFPEIIHGFPKTINDNDETADTYEFVADLSMKGTPVSQGVKKGYARVALNIVDASHLEPDEILITHCTDIGWSPYFPIIAGVVTEIGGLVSHGAVVSREYGLPCVVGMRDATKKFQTGDYVLLDGKKGILQRLPKPEE